MVFSLPLNQMPNVDKELLMSEVHKMSTWSVIIQYIINSKFRQSVKLVDWYNKDCVLAGDKVPSFDGTQKAKCIQALHYVRDYLVYKSDESVHGMLEHWQTPKETLTLRSADCEDGAILLLEILRQSGLPSSQVFLVAGDVQGGGHAYS
jgi:predicted transglutaminase-like cysteine proteinase